MSGPGYEYYGMMAQTWDLFRGDTSNWEDRAYYLQIIQESGEPALDVGCGTGRLLLDYMSQGIDIDGLDNSPEMLALCRQKAMEMGLKPSLFEGSMETMHLARRYRTIIVPSSSFQLLLEESHAKQAIQGFFDHLLAGGTLVMSFMKLWKEGFNSSWRLTGEKVRPSDSSLIKRWSRTRFDSKTQLEHTEDRYEVIKEGETIFTEVHRRSPGTREYTQQQATDLYHQAGFVNIGLFSGFTRQPAHSEDELFVVMGQRPE